jgi:hypothetical protein
MRSARRSRFPPSARACSAPRTGSSAHTRGRIGKNGRNEKVRPAYNGAECHIPAYPLLIAPRASTRVARKPFVNRASAKVGRQQVACLVERSGFTHPTTHLESGPLSTRRHSHEPAPHLAAECRSRKGSDENRSHTHPRYRCDVYRDRHDRSLDPVCAATPCSHCRRPIHKFEDGQARSVMYDTMLGGERRVAACQRNSAFRKHFAAR